MYNNKSAYICLWMYISDVTMMYLNSAPTSCNCSFFSNKIFPNTNREIVCSKWWIIKSAVLCEKKN